jgi:fatty-acyl-CoA synthase
MKVMDTFAGLLLDRAGDRRTGLLFEEERYSWAEVVRDCRDRAALALALMDSGRPPHIGVLLENVPEYLYWLGGAALAGATVVGINPTRRGAELAADIRHTDCQFIVTDTLGARSLAGLDLGLPAGRILRIDDPAYAALLDGAGPAPRSLPGPDTTLLLLFTSGSTGAPKAVICTQRRLATIAEVADVFGIIADSVTYLAMPMFHGNAIMVNVAPAVKSGATIVMRRRFSASAFLPDVRRHGVTYFNYVGRALAYILATPEGGGDSDNSLVAAFGTEASGRDMRLFAERFGCRLIESYGSSEGAISIHKTPDSPPDSLGVPGGGEPAIADPETGRECPRARFDEHRGLLNADEAIGEIVGKNVGKIVGVGGRGFEGYYRNPEADHQRVHDGRYWSGDLGYRDEDGYFYFAGRGTDRLRVDGENFAAGPVERILARWAPVVMCAVYPVPDPRTGDQVMAALEISQKFESESLETFLRAQPDLGTKWAPRFVRIVEAMPLTATNKVDKRPLRRESWTTGEVWWRPDRRLRYEPLTARAAAALAAEYAEHGRRPQAPG